MTTFMQKLQAEWSAGRFVCVGLDSALGRIPAQHSSPDLNLPEHDPSPSELIVPFNRAIIEATADLVCAYKPNAAFYEAQGSDGVYALEATIEDIRDVAPDVPVILDAKRGDIGSTNDGYVEAAFTHFDADAITVHPYLGLEAMKPFLDQADKGIIVLCRTSNPGAGEFQDRMVQPTIDEWVGWFDGTDEQEQRLHDRDLFVPYMPLYQLVALRVAHNWNYNGNCCLVVGATYPDELKVVREQVGDSLPILVPGVGAQGGDLEAAINAGITDNGQGLIINSSRGIIFASDGEDYADAARAATLELHEQITAAIAAEQNLRSQD